MYLTERGEKAAEVVKKALDAAWDSLMSVLTDEERKSFMNSLAKVVDMVRRSQQ